MKNILMGLFVSALFVVAFVSVGTGRSIAQQASCSSENNRCQAFCQRNPDRGGACWRDCANRMEQCLITGTYTWLNEPNKRGLLKK
jgi:hypothetical protein